MHDFARKQRVLEVNPQSPLIEGLLKRVKALPSPDDLEDPDLRGGGRIGGSHVYLD
jgi:heat shock protein beta